MAVIPLSLHTETIRHHFSLSRREWEIMMHIINGAEDSNKGIARLLGITESTVKGTVIRVLRKLDVSSRTQAALIIDRALRAPSAPAETPPAAQYPALSRRSA